MHHIKNKNASQLKQRPDEAIAFSLFYVGIFFLAYMAFYHQAQSELSDLQGHIRFIEPWLNGKKDIPYPLWHVLTYATHSLIAHLDIETCGILVNTAFVLMTAWAINYAYRLNIGMNMSCYAMIFFVSAALFSGNIFLPGLGLTKYQFLGNGSVSVWHSPTLWAVKPFSILSYFLFFFAIDNENTKIRLKFLLASFLFTVISVFAKPSFAIVFMPTIGFYIFYRYFTNKLSLRQFISLMGGLLAIAILLISYTYYGLYKSEHRAVSIVISYLTVWRHYSDNILNSIFVGNLFLIVTAVLLAQHLSEKTVMAIVMLTLSIIVFAFFAETHNGHISRDGNFGWSMLSANLIAYLCASIDFIKNRHKIKIYKLYIISVALAIQFVFGLYYFFKFLTDGSFV